MVRPSSTQKTELTTISKRKAAEHGDYKSTARRPNFSEQLLYNAQSYSYHSPNEMNPYKLQVERFEFAWTPIQLLVYYVQDHLARCPLMTRWPTELILESSIRFRFREKVRFDVYRYRKECSLSNWSFLSSLVCYSNSAYAHSNATYRILSLLSTSKLSTYPPRIPNFLLSTLSDLPDWRRWAILMILQNSTSVGCLNCTID